MDRETELRLRDRAAQLMAQSRAGDWSRARHGCNHGEDCPVCRATKEANAISEKRRQEEYRRRCDIYMAEFRAKLWGKEVKE